MKQLIETFKKSLVKSEEIYEITKLYYNIVEGCEIDGQFYNLINTKDLKPNKDIDHIKSIVSILQTGEILSRKLNYISDVEDIEINSEEYNFFPAFEGCFVKIIKKDKNILFSTSKRLVSLEYIKNIPEEVVKRDFGLICMRQLYTFLTSCKDFFENLNKTTSNNHEFIILSNKTYNIMKYPIIDQEFVVVYVNSYYPTKNGYIKDKDDTYRIENLKSILFEGMTLRKLSVSIETGKTESNILHFLDYISYERALNIRDELSSFILFQDKSKKKEVTDKKIMKIMNEDYKNIVEKLGYSNDYMYWFINTLKKSPLSIYGHAKRNSIYRNSYKYEDQFVFNVNDIENIRQKMIRGETFDRRNIDELVKGKILKDDSMNIIINTWITLYHLVPTHRKSEVVYIFDKYIFIRDNFKTCVSTFIERCLKQNTNKELQSLVNERIKKYSTNKDIHEEYKSSIFDMQYFDNITLYMNSCQKDVLTHMIKIFINILISMKQGIFKICIPTMLRSMTSECTLTKYYKYFHGNIY